MNSKVVYAFRLVLALLIVLPVLSTVNAAHAKRINIHSAVVADGTPAPPPVPHPNLQYVAELVADGTPAPPPVPHPNFQPGAQLVADGTPAPPPVPHFVMFPPSEPIAG